MDSRVKPENDLHGRLSAPCFRVWRDLTPSISLLAKREGTSALNDNKERIFINHSGHWIAQIKKRATRKLWYGVDRRPGQARLLGEETDEKH